MTMHNFLVNIEDRGSIGFEGRIQFYDPTGPLQWNLEYRVVSPRRSIVLDTLISYIRNPDPRPNDHSYYGMKNSRWGPSSVNLITFMDSMERDLRVAEGNCQPGFDTLTLFSMNVNSGFYQGSSTEQALTQSVPNAATTGSSGADVDLLDLVTL